MALNKRFNDIQKLYDKLGWNNADTLKNAMGKSADYIYIAFLTQLDTDPPVENVLYNDFISDNLIYFSYEGVGIYRIYSNLFKPDCMEVEVNEAQTIVTFFGTVVTTVYEGYIELNTFSNGVLTDSVLKNTPVRIKVWNNFNNVDNGGVAPSPCASVPPLPPGHIGVLSGPTTGICNASNVNYSLSTSDANSYSWTLPAGVTVSGPSNLNAINVNFDAGFPGTGTITVTGYYDCEQQSTSINVDGAPFIPTVDPAIIVPEASELYTASSVGATSYNWTLSGDDYSACTNPPTCSQYFVIWSVSGGSMSVTASNSCGTSDPTIIS